MRPTALALILLAASPAPSSADCGDYADNVLASSNCDADTDASGWLASQGSLSWEVSDGIPLGAVRMESEADKGEVIRVFLCADTAATEYSYSVAFKVIQGDVDLCLVRAVGYTGADCTGSASSHSDSNLLTGDLSSWRVLTGSATPNPHVSVSALISCTDEAPFTVLIDNAYLVGGDGEAPTFYDGFEDGDLEHWVSITP